MTPSRACALALLGLAHCGAPAARSPASAPASAHTPAPTPAPASAPPPPSVPTAYEIDDAAPHLAFRISLDAPCDTAEWLCERAADIEVFRKDAVGHRAPTPVVVLHFDRIELEAMGDGAPLVNATRLYDAQGVLNVGDFDFDGRDDFAVQVGHDGPYGGPTFVVYVDDPVEPGGFRENGELSELTRTTLGMFTVDAKHKHLSTLEKSGCCWHQATTYEVAHGHPIPIAMHTEQVSFDEHPTLTVTDEHLVGGRWHRRTTTRPADVDGP